jgi:hypothetical protein
MKFHQPPVPMSFGTFQQQRRLNEARDNGTGGFPKPDPGYQSPEVPAGNTFPTDTFDPRRHMALPNTPARQARASSYRGFNPGADKSPQAKGDGQTTGSVANLEDLLTVVQRYCADQSLTFQLHRFLPGVGFVFTATVAPGMTGVHTSSPSPASIESGLALSLREVSLGARLELLTTKDVTGGGLAFLRHIVLSVRLGGNGDHGLTGQ